MEPGKYYLCACSWDWTFVGKFSHIRGGKAYLDHCIYFIRTGARFGPLCHKGLVSNSEYCECGDGVDIGDYRDVKAFPWHAPTPWGNPTTGERGERK